LELGSGLAGTHKYVSYEEERANKLRAVMKKRGVAALLLEREDNIRYATGLPVMLLCRGLDIVFFR